MTKYIVEIILHTYRFHVDADSPEQAREKVRRDFIADPGRLIEELEVVKAAKPWNALVLDKLAPTEGK